MSPTSLCYAITKMEADFNGLSQADDGGGSSFLFGLRKPENVRLPLKVNKQSHRIRKPSLPLPQVQYRPPVIIHTYSPKVIHTEPDDFMSLVQKLTGSSDTRLRLKRSLSKKDKTSASKETEERKLESSTAELKSEHQVAASETISSISSAACSSPSSSEDSGFPTSNTSEGELLLRESVSPRGPLPYYESEFLNSDIFGSFDPSASSIFSHVKPEPSCFSFSDNSFNLLTEPFDSRTLKSLPRPPLQDMNSFNMDINSPIPSPGFLSPGLMADLPILSPGTGTWSQPLLDCLNANLLQTPAQRQRYSGGYSPSPGIMVAPSNIQAFMLS